MLRQIIVPTENRLTVELPDEYLNRSVEIIVFPIIDMETPEPAPKQIVPPDFALFRKYRGRYAGGFNREECYDRDLP